MTGQGGDAAESPVLEVETLGHVRLLRLNRPERKNAPSSEFGWIGRLPLLMRVSCDKPIVAGVNGIAIGAGLSLAMCADMRIAHGAARFHPGYARAGTAPDGGLSWTLTQALGHERSMRFLLEQRMVGSEEALRLGLVGEVAEPLQFDQRFGEYCSQLAESRSGSLSFRRWAKWVGWNSSSYDTPGARSSRP